MHSNTKGNYLVSLDLYTWNIDAEFAFKNAKPTSNKHNNDNCYGFALHSFEKQSTKSDEFQSKQPQNGEVIDPQAIPQEILLWQKCNFKSVHDYILLPLNIIFFF